MFNVPRKFQEGQQARASTEGREYMLESRRSKNLAVSQMLNSHSQMGNPLEFLEDDED